MSGLFVCNSSHTLQCGNHPDHGPIDTMTRVVRDNDLREAHRTVAVTIGNKVLPASVWGKRLFDILYRSIELGTPPRVWGKLHG